jgi:hypothetical protein
MLLPLALAACGEPPRGASAAVALPASSGPSAAASSGAAAVPVDAGVSDADLVDFLHGGARDVEPVDPGVVADADRQTLEAATKRARACITSAKLTDVRLLFRITLADDGTPHAELVRLEGGPLTASVSTCALRALESGRYTKPGTSTAHGPTKHFLLVHIEERPAPQEYQVD